MGLIHEIHEMGVPVLVPDGIDDPFDVWAQGLWIDFPFGELVCQLFLGELFQTGVGAEQFPDYGALLHGVESLEEVGTCVVRTSRPFKA